MINIKLSELARLLRVDYATVYKFTFRADFPPQHNGKWRRQDVYRWLVRTKRLTQEAVDALIAHDAGIEAQRVEKLREYNRIAKRASRARKVNA